MSAAAGEPELRAAFDTARSRAERLFGSLMGIRTTLLRPPYAIDEEPDTADQVRTVNATDKVTKVWRNHTFSAGIDGSRDIYRQINHNRVGNFQFGKDTSDPNDTNFAYAESVDGLTWTIPTLLGNFDTIAGLSSLGGGDCDGGAGAYCLA